MYLLFTPAFVAALLISYIQLREQFRFEPIKQKARLK
jgi:hypothetical protein